MSETFRVGDSVVFRDVNGELLTQFGVMTVHASDLSTIRVDATFQGKRSVLGEIIDVQEYVQFVFNAGTLRCSTPCYPQLVIAHITESELQVIRTTEITKALRNCIGTALDTRPQTESTLRAAYAALKGEVPQCQTCTFWRPPYDDFGPGNCHNQTVREMTRMGHETYPPPTPPEFGCNQWKAKQQPENGDDSDE